VKQGIGLCDVSEARNFLSEEGWLPFQFDSEGFCSYLEEEYFKPGTKKNAEFETMMGPINTDHGRRISFWIRIKDTPQNRSNLRRALEDFYGTPLPKDWEKGIERIRNEIITNLPKWYPI